MNVGRQIGVGDKVPCKYVQRGAPTAATSSAAAGSASALDVLRRGTRGRGLLVRNEALAGVTLGGDTCARGTVQRPVSGGHEGQTHR